MIINVKCIKYYRYDYTILLYILLSSIKYNSNVFNVIVNSQAIRPKVRNFSIIILGIPLLYLLTISVITPARSRRPATVFRNFLYILARK